MALRNRGCDVVYAATGSPAKLARLVHLIQLSLRSDSAFSAASSKRQPPMPPHYTLCIQTTREQENNSTVAHTSTMPHFKSFALDDFGKISLPWPCAYADRA